MEMFRVVRSRWLCHNGCRLRHHKERSAERASQLENCRKEGEGRSVKEEKEQE